MNEEERLLIGKRMGKELSNEEFLALFTTNIEENTDYFDKLLFEICIEKNGGDLDLLFYVGFLFDLIKERHLVVLNNLLLEDWHKMHTDIVHLLQYLKSNSSVESLYEAIFNKYKHLSYTGTFAEQCIWALGDINTPESREKLKLLSKSKDKVIKQGAKEQLMRILSDKMLKLYKQENEKILYWQSWENKSNSYIIHHGELGEKGEFSEIEDSIYKRASTIVKEKTQSIRDLGFKELKELKMMTIQFKIDEFGTMNDLDERYEVDELINDTLTWTGLGQCEDYEIGSGTMNISFMAVDSNIAAKVIVNLLKKNNYGEDYIIFEESEDLVVLWPPNYTGEVNF